MASTAVGFGVALIILGVAGYALTGAVSITALIPAFFGVVLGILGWVARNPARRKLAMHIAVVVGLLGFLGSMTGLRDVVSMLGGAEVARPAASISRALMAVVTGVFVALCVKSFVDARRPPGAKVRE